MEVCLEASEPFLECPWTDWDAFLLALASEADAGDQGCCVADCSGSTSSSGSAWSDSVIPPNLLPVMVAAAAALPDRLVVSNPPLLESSSMRRVERRGQD